RERRVRRRVHSETRHSFPEPPPPKGLRIVVSVTGGESPSSSRDRRRIRIAGSGRRGRTRATPVRRKLADTLPRGKPYRGTLGCDVGGRRRILERPRRRAG